MAADVVNEMRKRRSQLVEEATMVSRELMRVAMTPHELWFDGLEKAASQYMGDRCAPGPWPAWKCVRRVRGLSHPGTPTLSPRRDIDGMLETLTKVRPAHIQPLYSPYIFPV